jgi:hypothetical protein
MNDPAKKRPWFQFSLLTAIVVMLAASGLLGANLRPRIENIFTSSHWIVTSEKYGWPLSFRYRGFWSWRGIVADTAVAAIIIMAAGFLCESLVRRPDCLRKRREAKPEPPDKPRSAACRALAASRLKSF